MLTAHWISQFDTHVAIFRFSTLGQTTTTKYHENLKFLENLFSYWPQPASYNRHNINQKMMHYLVVHDSWHFAFKQLLLSNSSIAGYPHSSQKAHVFFFQLSKVFDCIITKLTSQCSLSAFSGLCCFHCRFTSSSMYRRCVNEIQFFSSAISTKVSLFSSIRSTMILILRKYSN